MRIALISDLHGNQLALEAVLSDVARVGVDRIVCLGDTATLGPHPREVLGRLRELRCTCILGNHDAFLLEPELVHSYSEAPIIAEAVAWCRDRLRSEDFELVRSFVPRLEIPLEGEQRLFVYHGTPRSHTEDLLATTPPEIVDEMLGGHSATVWAGGHTHIQMLRQHAGMLIVNPGSVGMPFEHYVAGKAPKVLPHAEWAYVESIPGRVAVVLQRLELDPAALYAAADASDNPLAPALKANYQR